MVELLSSIQSNIFFSYVQEIKISLIRTLADGNDHVEEQRKKNRVRDSV